jgi:hypothetical protein
MRIENGLPNTSISTKLFGSTGKNGGQTTFNISTQNEGGVFGAKNSLEGPNEYFHSQGCSMNKCGLSPIFTPTTHPCAYSQG